MTTKFVSRTAAWNILESMPNKHMLGISIVYTVSARTTKKDRVTKEPNPWQNLQKTVEVKNTSLNSDYETRVKNQLIRENKSESDYKKGKNSMPIEFCDNNKIVGTFNGKKVFCHFPLPNTKRETIVYKNDGIEVSKSEVKNWDIFPKSYAPKNQGISNKVVEIEKPYFDNIDSFTIDGTKYVIM